MALDVSISVSQSAIVPESVTVEDTSTGTDAAVTQRRIYVTDAYGNYLTGNGIVNYNEWAIGDAIISLSILSQDTAANILVDWLDVTNVVLYTYNNNYPLSEFGKQFLFYLVQLQGLTPGVYQDKDYSGNLAIFWTNIIAGDNAVTFGNDLSGAQNCYNRETFMKNHQDIYF